ncbi:MAG: NAD(P)H-hydrate dehydratase [Bacillota bacterium]|nr:NAD(P)H-hydrate dehydratase [Bacillota bacterium]
MDKTFSILDASNARRIDYQAIQEIGIPSLVLMEHAAYQSANIIKKYISQNDSICVVCGPGNNGADGLAIARLLQQDNYCVQVLLCTNHLSEDEQIQLDIVKKLNVPFCENIQNVNVIIDCIFGNGLNREIKDPYFSLIEQINMSNAKVFSIDVPSGLDASNGQSLGICIKADYTVALDCFKIGHFCTNGLYHCGIIHPVHIGIPYQLHSEDSCKMITSSLVSNLLPDRNPYSHKGTFGKALMIGGSQAMHGAITMAAKAAYQSGIGTLTLMIPDSIGDIMAQKFDFAMNLRAPSEEGYFGSGAVDSLKIHLNDYNVISVGNGMGQRDISTHLVIEVLKSDIPVILDADAFWAIRHHTSLLHRNADTILTPHVKELSRILNLSVKEIGENPIAACKQFCLEFPNCTLILKSSVSVIGKENQQFVLFNPNSRLSKGGSGDILCGILMGIFGQSRNALESAIVASYIHNQTANCDKDAACFLPEDSLNNIELAFKNLRKEKTGS